MLAVAFFTEMREDVRSSNRTLPWELQSHCGQGTFAEVKIVRHQVSGTVAALKVVDKLKLNTSLRSWKSSLGVLAEVTNLKCLHQTNVLSMMEHWETSDSIFIVLEYCNSNDVCHDVLCNGKYSGENVLDLALQLQTGLQYLQHMQYVHRDVKPENVLRHSTASHGICFKLGDFALCRTCQTATSCTTICGTLHYMAPDILRLKKKTDQVTASLWIYGVWVLRYSPFLQVVVRSWKVMLKKRFAAVSAIGKICLLVNCPTICAN